MNKLQHVLIEPDQTRLNPTKGLLLPTPRYHIYMLDNLTIILVVIEPRYPSPVHPTSSLPSEQSSQPSQTFVSLMHSPDVHWN